MLKEVIKIISQNIPGITALEMSENRLATLDILGQLAEKAPNVSILHLCDNNIRDVAQLKHLKRWKLTALKLSGNPLVSNYKDTAAYQGCVMNAGCLSGCLKNSSQFTMAALPAEASRKIFFSMFLQFRQMTWSFVCHFGLLRSCSYVDSMGVGFQRTLLYGHSLSECCEQIMFNELSSSLLGYFLTPPCFKPFNVVLVCRSELEKKIGQAIPNSSMDDTSSKSCEKRIM